MNDDAIAELVEAITSGELSGPEAAERLRRLPFADLGYARVDHHRSLRQGLGEVVFGPGKSPEQCVGILGELLAGSARPVILSRSDAAQRDAVVAAHPGAIVENHTVMWGRREPRDTGLSVLVVTAGTSDLPVADECASILTAHGVVPDRLTDVGVAGLHRLLDDVDRVLDADVVVVCAGMDGALASVIGGLAAGPVVAVPTSVGYGSAFDGVTPLLSMLASCAAGVTVVGIDNGFGAAVSVLRLLQVAVSA